MSVMMQMEVIHRITGQSAFKLSNGLVVHCSLFNVEPTELFWWIAGVGTCFRADRFSTYLSTYGPLELESAE